MKTVVNQKFYNYYVNFFKLKEIIKGKKQNYSANFDQKKKAFYTKMWTDTARELAAEIHDVDYNIYKIQLGANSTYVCDYLVMLDDHLTLHIAGNKPLISRILDKQHYPVAKYLEYEITSLNKAYKFQNEINRPAVVKPAQSGAAGKGITTGITSWNSLKKASFRAAIYSRKLLIEEQVEGESYRILFLNGKYIDAIRRNPPRISCNGTSTIKKLIELENKKRINSEKIIALHPLSIDLELKDFLKSQGYDLNDRLPANKTIVVKRAVNQNSRYENESVKNIVHPCTIKMGSEIAKLLNIQLAGLDVICKDIAQPLDYNNGVINEVNTTPGLHHHYLINDEAAITPVAVYIIKNLLNSKFNPFINSL